uniref:Frizzled class receptor 8 n=1 Tax=Scophthalmus maximus TaxID=52904 RepID=A0A8D3BQD0_SCOMX
MERSIPGWCALLLLPLPLSLVLPGGARCAAAKELQCQEISVPLCKGIGYNYTYMPNQFNHDTQDEAGLEVHQFWPLVEIKCSADLRFFLCSMYTPICLEDYKKPLPPCRSVCERARAGCAPLMRQYGFPWPDRMRCDLLPEQGDQDTLCMDYNRSQTTTASPAVAAKPTNRPLKPFSPRKKSGYGRGGGGIPGKHKPAAAPCEPGCFCRAPMVPVTGDGHPLRNRVKTGQILNCAMPCHNPYFTAEERTFTAFWIGLWSILCFVSTFATVATFLIDMERFKYPERPIIFLSACYMFVSVGYIVRLIAGHEEVACSRENGAEHIHYETTGPALCTIVFLLIYFFGMASSIWWVILSLTWFLAAGMKWGNEAIASYAQYFHLAAWLIPSMKSIAVLALSSVDGDSVAGICYVGNQNLDNLRGFVLAPLVIYLFIGHRHRGVLLLRAAQPAEVGDYAQLRLRSGPERAAAPAAAAAAAEAGLRRVHAQVLHVPAGGHHLGRMGLVRQDAGVVADVLHALLLGQQGLRGLHVQRREHGADVEVRHGELRLLPQTDAPVPGVDRRAQSDTRFTGTLETSSECRLFWRKDFIGEDFYLLNYYKWSHRTGQVR